MKSSVSSQEGQPPDSDRMRGAREEFASQFRGSFRVLWFVAAGIVGDRSLAEDVVQEAAIIGLNKYEQFEAGTNFTAWMAQTVRHVALNVLRKEQRHRSGVREAGHSVARSASRSLTHAPDEEAADRQKAILANGELMSNQTMFDDRVVRALGEIGSAPRACLLLRAIEGLEYSEISALLGIPEGTAMSHVHRSRQFLREKLGGAAAVASERALPGSLMQDRPVKDQPASGET